MNNNCNNPCKIINVLEPQGPRGPQGQIGPQGPQGPQGIPGLPLTNNFLSLQSVNLNLAYPDETTYEPVFYQTAVGNGNTITAPQVPGTGAPTLAAGHTYFIMISLDGATLSASAGQFYRYRVLINGNPMPVTPGTEWEIESLNMNTSFIYPANVDTTIQVEISPSNAPAGPNSFLRGAFLNIVQLI